MKVTKKAINAVLPSLTVYVLKQTKVLFSFQPVISHLAKVFRLCLLYHAKVQINGYTC